MRNLIYTLLGLLLLAGCPATQAEGPQTATTTLQIQPQTEAGEIKAPPAPSASLQVVTATFDVTGMDCESCSKAIETKVIGLPGVTTVSSDHKTGKTIVQFDEGKVTRQDIIAAINSLQFKASEAKP